MKQCVYVFCVIECKQGFCSYKPQTGSLGFLLEGQLAYRDVLTERLNLTYVDAGSKNLTLPG